jgi:phosphohistidine phosphatase SixA
VCSFGNPLELTLEEFANEPLGKVFFLRHTLAPGFDANGEPEKFNIEDCSTQRNLNTTGRKQAKKLGEEFVNYGIKFRKIFSSQWCRCIETGELLNLGQVSLESSLNSGFKGIFKKEKSLLILKKILEALNDDDEPILMVTHYGTILATTGISVDSGGGVVYNLKTRESKKILLK